jgi:hypothetical protein
VFHAHNHFQHVYAGDREVMTFDPVTGDYTGAVQGTAQGAVQGAVQEAPAAVDTTFTPPTTHTLAASHTPNHTPNHTLNYILNYTLTVGNGSAQAGNTGGMMAVLDGAGAGQYRTLVLYSHTALSFCTSLSYSMVLVQVSTDG